MNCGIRRCLFWMYICSFLMVTAFVGDHVFSIEKITILGNKEFVYNDLLKLSGVSSDQNILMLDKELMQKRIESNPKIEVISISRNFPDEVVITVREREIVAFIEYLTLCVMIGKDGVAIETREPQHTYENIRVRGLDVKGFVLGDELLVENVYSLDALKSVLTEINEQGLKDGISEISVSDINDIRIISDEGLNVRLGQAVEVGMKLRWMKTEQFNQLETGEVQGELDLSVHTQAVFIPQNN